MELPGEPRLRWILERTATLVRLGAEPVRGLILPTSDYFPDAFDRSPESVGVLVTRVLEHAGLSHLGVDVSIVAPDGREQTVSCSSGACGGTGKIEARLDRVARRSNGSYGLAVGAGEVGHGTVLTTAIARSVAYMFMCESGAAEEIRAAEHEVASDLAAVLLGFGVLVTNGAYVYSKGCGGVSVHSATEMPVDELGIALAVACRIFDLPARSAMRHLSPTPREAFQEGLAWVDDHAPIVALVKKDPEIVEAGDYKLERAGSWLERLFGKRRRPASAQITSDELSELERSLAAAAAEPRPKDEKRQRRLDEIRRLVEDSLEE